VKGVPTARLGEALFRILISVPVRICQCSAGWVLAASTRRYLAPCWPLDSRCSLAVVSPPPLHGC